MRIALLLVVAFLLAGCKAAPTATELRLAPGQYGPAFDVARDVLRDGQFELNRVDGRAGVITTYAKPTAGLFSPWDQEQSTFEQETDDLIASNRRRIRITFDPAAPAESPPAEAPAVDVRAAAAAGAELTMRVHVVLERIERPTWRPDTSGTSQYTRSSDPELVRRGMEPQHAVAVSDDRALAARIVEEVRERLARGQTDRKREVGEPPAQPARAAPEADTAGRAPESGSGV